MKAYLVLMITIIAGALFAMIYSHLNYAAPSNLPEWQLPGIADSKFVLAITTILSALSCFLLYI